MVLAEARRELIIVYPYSTGSDGCPLPMAQW